MYPSIFAIPLPSRSAGPPLSSMVLSAHLARMAQALALPVFRFGAPRAVDSFESLLSLVGFGGGGTAFSLSFSGPLEEEAFLFSPFLLFSGGCDAGGAFSFPVCDLLGRREP